MAIVKSANPTAPAFGTATTDAALRDELKTELIRKLMIGAPLALGIGAGVRGLMGVSPLVARHSDEAGRKLPSRTSVLHVTAPEHLVPPTRKRIKQAADPVPAPAAPLPAPSTPTPPLGWNAARSIAAGLGMLNPAGKNRGWSGWVAGDNASRLSHIPASAALPVGLPLAMLGGYGMTDWILDRTRKKELDSEVDNAKKDYEQALYDLGTEDETVKTSGEQALPELDALARTYVEKTATAPAQEKTAIWDTAGLLGAGMLTGGAATALLTGKATYDFLRSRDESKVLNEAFRRRQQQLFSQAPFPAMAVLDHPKLQKQPEKKQPEKKPAAKE